VAGYRWVEGPLGPQTLWVVQVLPMGKRLIVVRILFLVRWVETLDLDRRLGQKDSVAATDTGRQSFRVGSWTWSE
jgi:hypothetical protein